MARKRVDKKFAVTLLAVLGGGIAAAVVGVTVLRPKPSATKFIQMAELAEQSQDWQGAFENYYRANKLTPTPEHLIKQGLMARNASLTNRELVNQDQAAWQQAISMDPNNKEALTRLLDYQWERVRIAPSPAEYSKVRQYGQQLLKIEPTNAKAAAVVPAATLQGWMQNIETDPKQLDADIDAVQKLVDAGPVSKEISMQSLHADLMAMLLQAHLRKAALAAQGGHAAESKVELATTISVLDAATKGQDDDLPLQYKAAAIYPELARFSPDNAAQLNKAKAAMDRALALAVPEKPLYAEVNLLAAKLALGKGDDAGRQAAIAILKPLSERLPNDQNVRLNYADVLHRDDATRAQAIELLSRPVSRATDTSSAFASATQANLEWATRLALANYRIEAAGTAKTATERETILKQVRDDADRMVAELPEQPAPLIVRGRVEQLQQRHVDAVKTLQLAGQLIERRPERGPEYYDLLVRLAGSYAATGQSGEAKTNLREVIDRNPGYLKGRLDLIQILLRENKVAEAKAEYETAKKTAPANLPEMQAVQAMIQQGENRPDEATGSLDKLPETNKQERLLKTRLALSMQQFPTAARLLNDAYTEDTKDLGVAKILIQSLNLSGKPEEARKILTDALASKPDDLELKLLKNSLDKGTAEDARKLIEQSLDAEPDEYIRSMKKYQLNAQTNRPEALKYLARAAELKPDAKEVLDPLFANAIYDKKYDDAEKLLTKLTSMNADQAGGRLYRIRLLLEQDRKSDALRVARELTQVMPEFAQSWVTLGQVYAKSGQWEDALANFSQALQRQGNNADALRGSIEADYQLSRPADAKAMLVEAISRFPRDPGFQEQALNHELMFGDPTKALAVREQQAAGHEQDASVQQMLAETYLRVAMAQRQHGDAAASQKVAAKSVATYVHLFELQSPDMGSMANLTRASALAGDFTSAETSLRKAAESSEMASKPEPMQILGEFYLNARMPVNAEKAVREAARRGGTSAKARRGAAAVLAQIGKIDDAVAMLDGADNAASDLDLQRQRAEVLINGRRFEQAEKSIRKLLEMNPTDIDLQNLLSASLISSQNFDGATRQITATLLQDPRNTRAIYFRGLSQLLMPGGDLNAAIRDLQIVRDDSAATTEMRMMLVQAFQRQGDMSAVVRELRNIISTEPSNRAARLQLVDALLKTNPPQPAEGLKAAEEALAQPEFKNDPSLLLQKAQLQVGGGDPKGAALTAQAAVQASSGNAAVVQSYMQILLSGGMAQQVLTETDGLVKEGKPPVWIYTARGIARQKLNDREGAVNEFATAMQTASAAGDQDATASVAQNMAQALGADEAIKALSGRLDQGVQYRLMTALLYQAQNKLQEAVDVLEPAVATVDKLTPVEQSRVLRTAAMLRIVPGPQANYDRGLELYRKLLLINGQNIDVGTLNNIAFVLSEKVSKPDPKEALQFSQRAFDIVRQTGQVDPMVFDTHGWILVLNGQLAEGINILNEGLNRRSFLEGHYHLGMAYLKFGMAKEALDQLNRAQKLLEQNREQNNGDLTYKAKIADAIKLATEAASKSASQPAGQ